MKSDSNRTTRREFARNLRGALTLASLAKPGSAQTQSKKGAANWSVSLDDDWLFGGKFTDNSLLAEFDDRRLSKINLPHSVAKLSWQEWDPTSWQDRWIYRRHVAAPAEFKNRRVFLQFDGVMVAATPVINGHRLPEHLGGYLPFRYEITEWLKDDNLLAVIVDSRWKNVPPEGSPKGPVSIDYLEPGGIIRPVKLCAVPKIFLSDVYAKPVDVLEPGRRIEVTCSIDGSLAAGRVEVRTELLDRSRVVSRSQQAVKLGAGDRTEVRLVLSKLGNVGLWGPDHPRLYDVVTTLFIDGKAVHDYRVRIGFREARFEVDGFFLNGRRFRIFGLNRHELYPYVGAAMPARVMRRDAEVLRRDFNCNTVRCSHYPQSEAFLDACDELGLMVWEEIPGWQYVGDESWRELAVRDVRDMVVRDRNRPSIIIWGVRINESANDSELYRRTSAAARALDDSRPNSGSMTPNSLRNWQQEWHQDVFAFDDYHAAPDGSVGILEPLPGVPYVLAEAVGQFNYTQGRGFNAQYRRTADLATQTAQAVRHAQAHDRAAAFARCAGVIAWCGFDYGSLVNSYQGVKYPGVADVFRIPKLGAAFYLSQVSPKIRPVIAPDFYWDFAREQPNGPGKNSAIFSNCERLEVFVDGKRVATLEPDRKGFPHLTYAPFFCDLAVESGVAELRIDGYIGTRLAISKSLSADRTRDQLVVAADDAVLIGDGADATRLVFGVVDRFGAPRAFAGGEVHFELTGPGVITGDNPFRLADAGGTGAVWIRTLPKKFGRIIVTATHTQLGRKSAEIMVRPANV